MAKKFQELRDKMSPEAKARVKERTEELKKEMADGSGMVKESFESEEEEDG